MAAVDEVPVSMLDCFKLLKAKGFDVDQWINDEGLTPLNSFASGGELGMAKVLLEVGAGIEIESHSKTALSYAAREGHAPLVSLFLQHGARTGPNVHALHIAAFRGRPHVVKLLLEGNADVLEEDRRGRTPARFCVRGGIYSEGRAEALAIILEKGGDVSEVNDEGDSLLHTAARSGFHKCFELLVKKGIDVNVLSADDCMKTPLHMACGAGHAECVKELHRLGADMNPLDEDRVTPLFHAVLSGNSDCVSTMIELGANVRSKDRWGFSALHLAVTLGNAKCAYLLAEDGAPLDAPCNSGGTPLMGCMHPAWVPLALYGYGDMSGAKEDRTRVAKLLLEMGASVTVKVIECAGAGGMTEVLAECFERQRSAGQVDRATLSTVASTLVKHHDEVVRVRLVDKVSGRVSVKHYELNTKLVERLTCEQHGGEGSTTASQDEGGAAAAAPTNVLSMLLDPAKRGFKESEVGDASGAVNGKEVRLAYDGADFTEEGFGTVVEFLSTGRVDKSLINRETSSDSGGGAGVDDGGDEEADGHNGEGGVDGDGGASSRVGGKRKRTSAKDGGGTGGGTDGGNNRTRKRRRLFDGEVAGKALEAARFFCLENMTVEVKRLMDVYGFEYDEGGKGASQASSE